MQCHQVASGCGDAFLLFFGAFPAGGRELTREGHLRGSPESVTQEGHPRVHSKVHSKVHLHPKNGAPTHKSRRDGPGEAGSSNEGTTTGTRVPRCHWWGTKPPVHDDLHSQVHSKGQMRSRSCDAALRCAVPPSRCSSPVEHRPASFLFMCQATKRPRRTRLSVPTTKVERPRGMGPLRAHRPPEHARCTHATHSTLSRQVPHFTTPTRLPVHSTAVGTVELRACCRIVHTASLCTSHTLGMAPTSDAWPEPPRCVTAFGRPLPDPLSDQKKSDVELYYYYSCSLFCFSFRVRFCFISYIFVFFMFIFFRFFVFFQISLTVDLPQAPPIYEELDFRFYSDLEGHVEETVREVLAGGVSGMRGFLGVVPKTLNGVRALGLVFSRGGDCAGGAGRWGRDQGSGGGSQNPEWG